MLVGFTQQDMQDWTSNMYQYEKQKRSKKPFGKQFKPTANIVNSSAIREQERSFDPVLQNYRDDGRQNQARLSEERSKLRSLNKYYNSVGKRTRDFDIINLHGNKHEQKIPKNKAPIRNIYNPINNEQFPEYYFKNREVKLNPEKEFKNIKPKPRDFNIVTGIYKQDHQERHEKQIQQQNMKIYQKLNKRDYDSVVGRYYDPKKEEIYEEQLVKSQIQQSKGEKFNLRLPPTYISRQPLILDSSKPISQSLADFDLKRQKAKQRFKLKYILQREYEQRNIEHEQKKQRMLRNRVYNSHSFDQKAKQFDINQLNQIRSDLNNHVMDIDSNSFPKKLENLYNPSFQTPRIRNNDAVSERYSSQSYSSENSSKRQGIKSGGFY